MEIFCTSSSSVLRRIHNEKKQLAKLILIAPFLFGTSAYAIDSNGLNATNTTITQQKSRTITGTVVDKDGEPIIGANIIVKGTSNGTITDINGAYTLEVPDNAVIQISYIGYLSQEIPVKGQNSIKIHLIEDTQSLDEVVVVGYGTQKKGEVASAISSVKSDNFVKVPTTDAAQLIRGQVAGLNVVTPDANPVGGSQITLRGAGTLISSATPLVLIDGVPGDLNTVSPDAIE